MDLHARMLAEMGVKPLWRLRSGDESELDAGGVQPALQEPVLTRPDDLDSAPVQAPPKIIRPATLRPVADIPVEVAAPVPPLRSDNPVYEMGWDSLHEAIRDCQACGLCKHRKQVVPGVGDREADWMFVGEGPGAEEDACGEPFVGQAGKLLDAMLDSIELKRGENVYIANAVKCRPPGNRTPEASETEACRPFLERQIELVKPKLLIALGRPAAQTLLQREVRIGQARGHLYSYMDIPVVVTYHPAYLLRNLEDKARAWEDLCFMRKQSESWE